MPYFRKDKFDANRAFTGIKFGKGKYLLELELDEMQRILIQQVRNSNKLVFKDGFVGIKHLTLEGTTLKFLADSFVKDGLVIPLAEEIIMTLPENNNSKIYFEVKEVVVRYDELIPNGGNTHSTTKLSINDILDEDVESIDKETSRRIQIQYSLNPVDAGTKYTGDGFLVANVTSGVLEVLVEELTSNLTQDPLIIEDYVKGYMDNVLANFKPKVANILAISHVGSNAPLTPPFSIEYIHNISLGENAGAISLVDVKNPNVEMKSSVNVTNGKVLNLVPNTSALKPNTSYKTTIPYRALKDRFGNVVEGIFVHGFSTGSNITNAEGIITDLGAEIIDEEIRLGWRNLNNPSYYDIAGYKILRRTDTFPTSPTDPNAVFINNTLFDAQYDSKNLEEGATYYYSIYPYDSMGNFNINASSISITYTTVVVLVYTVTPTAKITDVNRTIAEAPANSIILFSDGEFRFNGSVEVRRSDVTLKGNGKSTKLFQYGNSKPIINVEGVYQNNISNIAIEGFTLLGGASQYFGPVYGQGTAVESGISITYVGLFDNTTTTYDKLLTKRGIAVSNCDISGCANAGIKVEYSNTITINDNHMYLNYSDGILAEYSKNIAIFNNRSHENLENGSGIDISYCSFVTIRNNSLKGNAIDGIDFDGDTSTQGYHAISNNTVTGNKNHGMSLRDIQEGMITSNVIDGGEHSGILLMGVSRNVVLSTNVIKSDYDCISVGSTSSDNITNVSILGNNMISHVSSCVDLGTNVSNSVVMTNNMGVRPTVGSGSMTVNNRGTGNLVVHNIDTINPA